MIFFKWIKRNAHTVPYVITKNITLSHIPDDIACPATCDASPTEKGFVIAAEKPKHADIKHAPKPIIVSIFMDIIIIITMGKRVTRNKARTL